jgi:hypothetical protein
VDVDAVVLEEDGGQTLGVPVAVAAVVESVVVAAAVGSAAGSAEVFAVAVVVVAVAAAGAAEACGESHDGGTQSQYAVAAQRAWQNWGFPGRKAGRSTEIDVLLRRVSRLVKGHASLTSSERESLLGERKDHE